MVGAEGEMGNKIYKNNGGERGWVRKESNEKMMRSCVLNIKYCYYVGNNGC